MYIIIQQPYQVKILIFFTPFYVCLYVCVWEREDREREREREREKKGQELLYSTVIMKIEQFSLNAALTSTSE